MAEIIAEKVSAQMEGKTEFLFVLFLNIMIEDGMHRYIKDRKKEIPQGINKAGKRNMLPSIYVLIFPSQHPLCLN